MQKRDFELIFACFSFSFSYFLSGKIIFANGNIYEGDFVNDNFHGKGCFTYASGDKYSGDFEENKKSGQGECCWLVHDLITADLWACTGLYTWRNGDRYQGSWRLNVKHGFGIASYLNGDCYEGYFQDNKKNGKGMYTYANGDIFEGDYGFFDLLLFKTTMNLHMLDFQRRVYGRFEGRAGYTYLSSDWGCF